ncbi:extracellular solute-binding protein [Paenibacillus sp. WQ 127069]|uniref:Extracellular solute-binding protein n=1 Tax=Paenibacillus baimaensis TaxID=2982185 RepID=A0ABT2ULX3_9BACL|nr:extracellular solute-binding protein [Paenibacillus sp. WQ 127069]MCU6795081.1 extracellular solute-binding protein [Paenibacillus sp. WQ 127069]
MKRLAAMVTSLLVVIALLLSACSGAVEQSGTDKPGGEEKAVTLKYWYPASDELVIAEVKSIIAKFEAANPKIKIELTTIPFKDYFQKLSVAYSGGIAPDVHGLGFGQLISTVEQDKYMDLNKFIKAEQWAGSEDMFPSILKAGEWKGGQYGILMPEIRPLVWRKDFFTESGLDPNKPPATIDEIFEFAEKAKVMKDGKTTRAGIDLQTSNGEQSYLSLMLLLGQDIYDDKNNPTFDSPESIALVEKMVALYKSGAIIPANQQALGGTPFQNSQAALAFASSPSLSTLQKAVGADKIGWALPPKGPTGKQTALMLGTFLTMSKSSKHPEESWKFIKFWFDKKNIYDFTLKTGFVPPLKSLKDEYVKVSPENEIIFKVMNDTKGYAPSADWAIHTKYLRIALEESFNGIRPVAEALKDNAKKARDEIKNK